jgi:hypothetical protein
MKFFILFRERAYGPVFPIYSSERRVAILDALFVTLDMPITMAKK